MTLGNCKLKWDTTTCLLEWPKSKTLITPNAREHVERQELLLFDGGNIEWYNHFGRQLGSFFYKSEYTLISWPRNHAPHYLPKWIKNLGPHKNLQRVFIVAFFMTDKSRKQPRYPLGDEWINKLWYIQTMEYYSALKRNEPSSNENIWRKLKCILLSERSQFQKATYCIIPTI